MAERKVDIQRPANLVDSKTYDPGPSILPPAGGARLKFRHKGLLASFFLLVILPFSAIVWYLNFIAADQFASRVGFSIRSEETTSVGDLFGGLAAFTAGSSNDSDILYEFIKSPKMVQRVDLKLGLREIYGKPKFDPVFAFNPEGTIEDLSEYWSRMVKVDYDAGTGVIQIRTNAFSPEDAKAIAEAIYDESSGTINYLSAIARNDITRYAKDELETSLNRLKTARSTMAEFRNKNQIVDPSADVEVQMGLLTSLQTQLSEALIEADLLKQQVSASDPRITDVERKVEVIERRIEEERKKFGLSSETAGENPFSSIVTRYEEISTDLEFAQESYLLALAAYDAALAHSRRQSRYLAAYMEPTEAQRSEYPQRGTIAWLSALFLFLGWAIGVLVFYSIKDRR